MITSRSRKAAQSKSIAPATARPSSPSSSGGSLLTSFGNRVSRLFTGSGKEKAMERQTDQHLEPPRSHAKRSYGFATSNLSNFSDQHSEDLYRYKNISSDYMRESSPTRDDHDDDRLAAASRSVARKNSNDDRRANARRPVPRKRDADEKSAGVLSSGGFDVRETNDKLNPPADRRQSKDKDTTDDKHDLSEEERL